mgnify:CR=1 FL=1
MKGFSNIPVRFFVVDIDPETEEMGLFEVDEQEFLARPGEIEYCRHTVRENGVSQITLTKGLNV